MKRYFINYKTDAIITETDPEQIAQYLASGWTEVTEEEYEREDARIRRIWADLIRWCITG